jgi:membrane fusion protein (multidrug efflux system)
MVDRSSLTTVDVSERVFPKTLLLTGSLEPNQSSNVASEGAGKVVKTFLERGSRVKKGEVIARLDASAAALAAAEASASAQTSKTQARHAKLECERAEKLFAERVISRAEYDQAKASCDSAGSSASAANARAARASKEVSDAVIRAPFSGVVMERFVSVGEYVMPGTKIARIVEVDPMRIELGVPEIASGKIAQDQTLRFEVASLPGRALSAKVRYVGPALEDRSRNLTVEAIVDHPDTALLPGMFATTRVAVGTERALAIPESAVGGDSSSPRVFVVSSDRIEERVVSLGEHDAGQVEVNKGLANGERVVNRPGADLRDGIALK